ncbi:hypothetical protein [Leisingera sp. JC11]|uniref:type II toxin-antitoxin system VapC family toxin n=1 Tax=Leisingera sp. JC11 TaxID=3042469 RepID=UPI003455D2C7
MTEKKSVLWDTCVLYRWLTRSPADYVDHIEAHIADAEAGKAEIFISSISLAELRPSRVADSSETPAGLLTKLGAFISVVDTIPDIMSIAGCLRDNRYVCSTDGPKVAERKRELTLGDAIQLATAIWMREYAGVQDLELHTFDNGKSKNSGESGGKRAVPMLDFHNWCKGLDDVEVVQLAREIKRKKPDHPLHPIP